MADSIYPYKLANGSVRYRVSYRSSNGCQSNKRGFATRRAARDWLTDKRAAARRGEVVVTHDSFATYIDDWLQEHRPRLEPGTYSDYEIHIRRRLKPFFGEQKLSAITARDVRRYVAALAEEGRLSAKTINNSLIVLRVALGHAEEDGLIAKNPAMRKAGSRERIKLPAAHVEMDYLRLHEIPLYLDGCSDTYRPLAEVLIATGLRISEALTLTFGDVDWEANALRVVRSGKRVGFGSTKGDRSRSVDFGPRIEASLRELLMRRDTQGGDPSRAPVFVGPRGGRLSRNDITRDDHKEALRAAGLRTSLRLHDLRHTAAAAWLTIGLPMIYVQRQLGHASITTTQEQYGHLEESFLKDAQVRTEAAIWQARQPAALPA